MENIVISPNPRDPEEIPVVSAVDFLLKSLNKHLPESKDRIWLNNVVTETSVKFGEVEPMSRKIASALSRKGFGKSDILYFVTHDLALIFLVQFSCWRCNGATRGGYPNESTEEFVRQMKQTRNRFVLVDTRTAPAVKKAIALLEWDVHLLSIGDVQGATSVEQLLEDDGSAFPENVEVNPKEDVIMLTNTSGSTGKPKATMITHFNLVAVLNIRDNMTPVEVVSMGNNFGAGANFGSFIALRRAITGHNVPQDIREEYFAAIQRIRPFGLLVYPYFAAWFAKELDVQKTDMNCVKAISFGGAAVDISTVKLLQSKLPGLIIIQNYGLSECISVADCSLFDKKDPIKRLPRVRDEGEEDLADEVEYIHTGKLTPYSQARIVDIATGEVLGRNRKGEIQVKSPAVMKGYYNEPELTTEVIDSEGWFHTGDLGFFDEESNLYVLERISSTFKYLMHLVSPVELEGILQQHPAVFMAGVVGIPHPECTHLARAFVVKRPGHDVTEEELKKFVADRTAVYKRLRGGVVFVESLPENSGAKLDRVKLRKMALAGL